jgi:branched-chain amino acid transport system substrate-binding protein
VALVAACGKNEEKPADQAAAPAATSAPAAAAAGGGETVIKIGHAAPLTGGIAHLGKDNENGARLAVEDVNKDQAGTGGRR